MSVFDLQALRLGDRGPDAYGNIIGDVVPPQGENRGVADSPFAEQRDVRGSSADIHEDDAQLHLVGGEDRRRRSDLLEDDVLQPEPGLLSAFRDIAHR